jgi:ankyrin repeat protein
MGRTALMIACMNCNNKIIDFLTTSGANVDISDDRGDTPLIISSMRNNVSGVKRLIAAGADINAENNNGESIMQSPMKEYIVNILISNELVF